MKRSVVAFEGNMPDDAPVAWGVAALREAHSIINAETGDRIDEIEYRTLVTEGQLTELPTALELRADDETPCYVLAIARRGAAATVLRPDAGKHGFSAGRASKTHAFFAFPRELFRRYTRAATNNVVRSALAHVDGNPAEAAALALLGLTLDPAHPELNALRCFLAEDRVWGDVLARKSLGEEGNERYEDMLRALDGSKYVLHYEGGPGGLGVDVASSILGAIDTIYKGAREKFGRAREFLEEHVAPPRFLEMRHGSAELHFVTRVQGESATERVARYYDLKGLGRVLDGDTSGLERLTSSIERVTSPEQDTVLLHRRVDQPEEQEVRPAQAERDIVVRREHLTLFGFETGLAQAGQNLEVTISPRRRISVSTRRGDEDQVPIGIEYIHETEAFPFAPVLVDITRTTTMRGREAFYLSRLARLQEGARVSAFPSEIAEGAFLRLRTPAVFAGDVLLLDQVKLRLGREQQTLPGVQALMRRYASAIREFELVDAQRSEPLAEYLPPPVQKAPPARERVLSALVALGGRARTKELVRRIQQDVDEQGLSLAKRATGLRDNNTRREVIRNPELIEFDAEDKSTICVTASGRAHLTAFRRATTRKG
jgi:hypothetical protein